MANNEFKDRKVTLREVIDSIKRLNASGLKIYVNENSEWFCDVVKNEMATNDKLKGFTYAQIMHKALKELEL